MTTQKVNVLINRELYKFQSSPLFCKPVCLCYPAIRPCSRVLDFSFNIYNCETFMNVLHC